jgi:5-methylcytosine-specific restriction protein A
MGDKRKLNKLPPRLNTLSTKIGSDISTKRITGSALQKINDRIAARDNYICQICHRFVTTYEIDHKIPLFMGGQEVDENRQLLCISCHKNKTAKEESERQGWVNRPECFK